MAKLIITRSIIQGQVFADKACATIPSLTHQDVMLTPLLDIQRVPIVGAMPKSYDAIIVTSVNSIPTLLEYGDCDKPFYCVGEATAKAVLEQGIKDIKIVASTVADLIVQIQMEPRSLHFCYFRGKHVSEDIRAALLLSQHKVSEYICYDALAIDFFPPELMEALEGNAPHVLVFFSKRTVDAFTELTSQSRKIYSIGHLKTLCISNGVLNCLPEYLQGNAYSAKTPDANGMLDLIRVHLV